MAGFVVIFCIFTAFTIQSASSDIIPSDPQRVKSGIESCTTECMRKVLESNIVGSMESCGRGCRFLNIAHLISDSRNSDQNSSRNSCKNMCQESYKFDNSELISCKTGCDLSVVQSVPIPLMAEFSWSLFIDNGNSLQILQGEVPEADDVLTDPGLRSQVSKIDLHHLPEVSLRTLPVQTESRNDVSMGPCAGFHNPALPYSYCLLWSLLLLLLLFVLWSCLSLADLPLQQTATNNALIEEKLPLA